MAHDALLLMLREIQSYIAQASPGQSGVCTYISFLNGPSAIHPAESFVDPSLQSTVPALGSDGREDGRGRKASRSARGIRPVRCVSTFRAEQGLMGV